MDYTIPKARMRRKERKFFESLKGKPMGVIRRELMRYAERQSSKVVRANHERTDILRAIHKGEILVVPSSGLILHGPVPDHNRTEHTILEDFGIKAREA